MKRIIALFLLIACGAWGAIETRLRPVDIFGPDTLIVPSGSSWFTLTNTIGRASSGDSVVVSAGTYFGTNTFSWFKDGVNILFMPGVTIRHGLSNNHSGGNIFTDDGVARSAAIMGWANFYISNGCYLAFVSNVNSRLLFECNNAYSNHRDTGQPLIQVGQSSGGTADFTIRDTAFRRGYDIFVVGGGGQVTARGRRLLSGGGNQAIETSANKPSFFDFDIIETDTNAPIDSASSIMLLDGDTHVRTKTLLLHSNQNVSFFNLSGGVALLEAGSLVAQTNNTAKMVDVAFALGPCIIANTRIVGPTATAADAVIDLQGDGLILKNVDLFTAGVNSISANGGTIVDLVGSVFLGKPPAATVVLNGQVSLTNGIALQPVAQALSADNQTVNCTNRSYIQLSSDNVTAANRTFVLSQGIKGQSLKLEWTGTNAGEIADDSSNTGGGNARLNGTWTPTQYDVLFVDFNGTDWIERGRSAN